MIIHSSRGGAEQVENVTPDDDGVLFGLYVFHQGYKDAKGVTRIHVEGSEPLMMLDDASGDVHLVREDPTARDVQLLAEVVQRSKLG